MKKAKRAKKGKKGVKRLKIMAAQEFQAERKYKIADVVFAYKNQELIKLLKLRGEAIKYQKFDEMRAIEAQMDALK